MHTKTNLFHRHAVAVPLVTCALLGILGTTSSMTAASAVQALADQVTEAGEQDTSFALSDGLYGRLTAGSRMAVTEGRPELTGSALVAADGIAWVKVGTVSLLGFGGGMYVHTSEDTITISALSTPVLLRHADFIAFVPQGRQATWNVTKLPAEMDTVKSLALAGALQGIEPDFHREALGTLAALAAAKREQDTHSVTSIVLSAGTDVLDVLRFPAARERAAARDLSGTFDKLATLIADGDSAGLHELLSREDVTHFLETSPESTHRLAGLLHDASRHPGMALDLLPFIQDPDFRLLASLHGDLRDAAWLIGGDTFQTQHLRILLFPLADTLQQAAPALIVSRWADALEEDLRNSEREPAVAELLASLNQFVSLSSRLGYPDRLERTLGAVERVLAATDAPLTEEQSALLASWKTSLDLPLEETPAITADAPVVPESETVSLDDVLSAFGAGSTASASSVAPEQAQELIQVTRSAIQNAGGLFTVETAITPVSADRIAVSGIVFADHFYSFEYVPSTNSLSAIAKDGEKLPFGMEMGKFTEWIRGE